MAIKIDLNYFGEWSQNVVIGLLTGLISGIFVSLIFTYSQNPLEIAPVLLEFGIFIAIVVTINIIIQYYRQEINKKNENPPKSVRPQKNIQIRFNWDLFAIITLLIVVGIGSLITPCFFISPLIGIIIGAILALLSAHFMFETKRKQDLRIISRGFYIELDCYKDWMQSWIESIKKCDDLLMTKGLIDVLFSTINRPFFDSDSLYYTLRKEMFLFDSETSEKLFEIYSLIRGAEESRRILLSNSKEHFHPNVQKEQIEHITQNFQKALHLISDIEQEFNTL
jgi:hypothetical protein